MTMVGLLRAVQGVRVFGLPERVRCSTSESHERAVEVPDARNVGAISAQLRAQIGTEVALMRLPVLKPTKRPKGSTSTESRRSGTSLRRSLERKLRPSRPSSAAWRAASRPPRLPKVRSDQLWVLIGERSFRMRIML
jgi:hypothetical protein